MVNEVSLGEIKSRRMIVASELKSRMGLFFLAFLYVVALHVVYTRIVSVQWAYMGHVYNDPPMLDVLMAWLASTLTGLWMPIDIDRPSKVVYWLFYLFVIVPVILTTVYMKGTFLKPFLRISLPVLLSFLSIGLFYRIPLLKVRKFRISNQTFWTCFVLVLFASYIYILSIFGPHLEFVSIFSSEDVYSIRLAARSVTAGKLIGYVMEWCANLLNPFLIAYGLNSKKYSPVVVGVCGQILLYSAEATKGTLLSVLVFFGLFLLLSKHRKQVGLKIFVAIICVVMVSCLLDYFLNSNVFVSMIGQRQIFTHGLLTTYYFDFFSTNPKAYMGYNKLLSNFVDYPYTEAPSFVIGHYYFESSTMNANENFWASAYADFGYFGLFVYGIIVGLLFWLCDSLTSHIPVQFSAIVVFSPFFSLVSASLFTSLLTHGILLLLFFLWVIPQTLVGGGNG